MSEAYLCYDILYYGIAGMFIVLLLTDWVVVESKFIKKYSKTSSRIHLVMLPIMAILILLMCVVTKHILPFTIMSCAICYDNQLRKEMLYGENKDSINDRKE